METHHVQACVCLQQDSCPLQFFVVVDDDLPVIDNAVMNRLHFIHWMNGSGLRPVGDTHGQKLAVAKAGMLMFQGEKDFNSTSHASLNLRGTPPMGMHSP
nr:uncharacterized protein LOC112425450 isoform X2 [Macaca nemestrina]